MDKVCGQPCHEDPQRDRYRLIAATLFEAVLTGIRTAVFANASSKIDVELGTAVRTPLELAGQLFSGAAGGRLSGAHQGLENIRAFLTSNAMTLVLDIVFSFVFGGDAVVQPDAYRDRGRLHSRVSAAVFGLHADPAGGLNDKFNKGAENQSFPVETLSGMDTVKAMAVEPRWQQRWDKQLAAYVSAGLSTTNVATVASGGVSPVSKLVTAGIMWLGALLVVDNKMTVGELVAFNMLAGQVSAPILRLAQLWNDFQQVGISMSRLGDILNARTEVAGNKTRIPRVSGAIEFDRCRSATGPMRRT